MNPNNPLKQYFRQPSIYIRLPSQGKYYPPNSIDIPENLEFPVYPMTAIDEITYRTPDALYNGQAIVSVVESCVPNIKNGWGMPAMDLDSILVAIRIASYGHEMPFASVCPKCGHEDERALDLRHVLDSLKSVDYSKPIIHGDMQIYFKPMSYKNLSDNNKSQYETQRTLQQITSENTPEAEQTRSSQYEQVLKQVTEITILALAQSIAVIVTPTAQVTEQEYILDLLKNCDRKLFDEIRDYVINAKSAAEIQPLHLVCTSCNNEYDQTVTLNMSDFFAAAS